MVQRLEGPSALSQEYARLSGPEGGLYMNDETQARMDAAMAALADYFRKPESERQPGELGRLQAERDAVYQESRTANPNRSAP